MTEMDTENISDAAFDFRAYANDPDRITDFSRSNEDVNSLISVVEDNADAIFTWDYEKGRRPALNKLYEKAKTSQWNGQTDLDWSIDVDPYAVLTAADPLEVQYFAENPESPLYKFNEKEWTVYFSLDLDGWGHYAFKPEVSSVAEITVRLDDP